CKSARRNNAPIPFLLGSLVLNRRGNAIHVSDELDLDWVARRVAFDVDQIGFVATARNNVNPLIVPSWNPEYIKTKPIEEFCDKSFEVGRAKLPNVSRTFQAIQELGLHADQTRLNSRPNPFVGK